MIRHSVNTITSDALDALYEQLEAGEATESQRQLATARAALASATTRAARAEATVARIQALVDAYPVGLDTALLEEALDQPAPAATEATEPREHCGDLKPQFSENTARTECVLRPGHTGSHADHNNTRWWWTDEAVAPPEEAPGA